MLGEKVAAPLAERLIGVVANFATGDVGKVLIEERSEGAEDAALGLTAETEQDEVLFRQDRIDDLGNDGVVVAYDSGEERLFGLQPADEVGAHLVFDGACGEPDRGELGTGAQFIESSGQGEGKRASCRHRGLLWAAVVREAGLCFE